MELLVIDGNSILNRAFYGVGKKGGEILATKNGEYTNAVYGFLTMMLKILSNTKPDAVAIAFDRREPTFRHKKYDGYKSNRHGMPDELVSQLPIVKELLQYLGYHIVECAGFEADDILGTLARECENTNNECIIATGDKDSLQLVSDFVKVRLITTKNVETYDKDKILEDYGVTPEQLIDVKAIQGDSSDNIPGVSGIGEKGAIQLISKYGSLDYIYNNLDELDIKPAMRKKLEDGKDSAYLSRFLGEISRTAPIDTDIKNYIIKPVDNNKAYSLMKRLEMFSLIKKFGITEDTDKEQKAEEIKICKEFNGIINLENLESLLKKQKLISFLICNNQIYLCLNDKIYICEFNEKNIKTLAKCNCKKITSEVKQFYAVLDKINFENKGLIIDIELMAYLINPSASEYSIGKLCAEYDINNVLINYSEYEISDDTKIIIKNVASLQNIFEILEKKLKDNNQEKLFYDIEMPFANVLACMENQGFMADKDGIEKFGNMLEQRIENIKKSIHKQVGYEFNINSPKQLGVALFEKLGLPTTKKNKSGYSTNAEVLEDLALENPVVEQIIEYRKLTKLKSTYCDGMVKVIDETGRIHSVFKQTETKTGRISSTEPNLQNIPVRTELGREMRKFFIAKEGCVLVDADYSQIELRVLANLANDEEMYKAFKNNYDIHAITASQVFGKGIPVELVTSTMRSRAKAVNFGIVYGIRPYSLSKDIGVTVKEAGDYIKSYLEHYKGIKKYMEDVVNIAKEKGYVETMFNRRRDLPELKSSNKITRAFGERVALNMPIQGTAADIIKIAMIKVFNRLKAENLKAKLILQVHDELIVETPVEEQWFVTQILKEEMENAVKMSVPLIVDINCGESWYDAKG